MKASQEARDYAERVAPNDIDLWNNVGARKLAAAAYDAGVEYERKRHDGNTIEQCRLSAEIIEQIGAQHGVIISPCLAAALELAFARGKAQAR